MFNLSTFLVGVVAISIVFYLIPRIVLGVRKYNEEKRASEKKTKEELYWWLRGGKPNEALVSIGYEFFPLIFSANTRSLSWPEFNTLGGGTRRLFDQYILGGYENLKPGDKMRFTAIVGHLKDVKNWYELSLKEKIELIKSRLPSDYVQKHFT